MNKKDNIDKIFLNLGKRNIDFVFDEEVVNVFDNMIKIRKNNF